MKQMQLGLNWNIDGHRMEVTKIFKNGKVQITETWVSEDTWKDCKHTENYGVGTDDNGNEYAYAIDYPEYKLYATGADNWSENKEEKEMANAQVQIIEIEVEGIRYTQTRPGYYYKKTEDGQKRISKGEWEIAFEQYIQTKQDNADADAWQAEADAELAERQRKAAESDKAAEDAMNGKKAEPKTKKEEKLNAEMKKLGYYRIDSEWNDIRYSTCDGQSKVMAWNTVEEGLKWVKEQTKGQKAAKPRKSKDIAHESKGITLTAKQVDFIKHIPDTCLYENGLDSCPWCDVLADEIGGQFAGKPMTVGAMISTLREKDLIYVGTDRINGKKAKYFGFTELGKEIAKELGLN